MHIQISYDASASNAPSWFKTAVSYVAGLFDALLTNPITVSVDFGWGEEDGNPVAAGSVGQSQSFGSLVDYTTLRRALNQAANSADDWASVEALPAADPTGGGNFYVPDAELKALGLDFLDGSGPDGYVGLDSSAAWSSSLDGTTSGGRLDPIGTIEHELSEVLGRIGGLGGSAAGGAYAPMDLFRYAAPGQRELTEGPGYFSVDGQTLLLPFNDPGNGGDAADWDASVAGDAFGDAEPGLAETLSSVDLEAMDVVGYTLASSAQSVPGASTLAPAPTVGLDPGVVFESSTRALLTGTVSDPAAEVSVFDGSTYLGAASVGQDGSWSLEARLTPGRHADLNATATVAGATGSASASFALRTGILGQPYTTLEQDFDASGNLIGDVYGRTLESTYLEDTVHTFANGNHAVIAQDGTYFDQQPFYKKLDRLTPGDTLLTEVLFNRDGTHTISGQESGLTIGSLHDDLITGGGNRERFVFKPHPGQETITDFQAAGAAHDVISLSSSEFSSVAAILSRTRTVGGDAVITLDAHDTITVQNVTAATLRAHHNDFALHA